MVLTIGVCPHARDGSVPEWLKGPDCKSGGLVLRWFKSILTHQLSTTSAEVAQLVERCVEGAGVGGSIPSLGTNFKLGRPANESSVKNSQAVDLESGNGVVW